MRSFITLGIYCSLSLKSAFPNLDIYFWIRDSVLNSDFGLKLVNDLNHFMEKPIMNQLAVMIIFPLSSHAAEGAHDVLTTLTLMFTSRGSDYQ